jgi:hypothetical protein
MNSSTPKNMMETLDTKTHASPAQCPLAHPLTGNAKACASCVGTHSPAQSIVTHGGLPGKILRYSLPRAIYDCAWGTLHWNRQYMASPAKPWKQQAAPTGPMPLHFRISYFTMATVVSVVATFGFGMAIARSRPDLDLLQGGLAMLLMAGPGWILQALLALAVNGMRSMEYLSHLATVMWKGILPLAVVSLVAMVSGPLPAYFFLAAVLMSSLLMARDHFRRVNLLGLSQSWTLTWFLLLQLSAWGIAAFLPFVQPILNWQ